MKQHDKIITLYLESINLFSDFEKKPRHFGTEVLLYNSEIDTLMIIGEHQLSHQGINLTNLAQALGISKSGTSRFIKKLLDKQLILKEKKEGNEKEVLFTMTEVGWIAFNEKAKLTKRLYDALYQNVLCYVQDDLNRIEEFLVETNEAVKKLEKNSK